MNEAKQAGMDRAGELPVERRVAERRTDAGRVATLEAALRRIARWHGEFPSAGVWEDGTPKSYGGAFGSNGERDYMRQVALDALAASASQLDAPAPPEVAVEPMTTADAREYLVEFMMEHFTDKTFHRYIRGNRNAINLAGDFAWQMATALRKLAASPAVPVAAGLPAIPEGWKLVPSEPTEAMLVAGQRSGVNSAWSYDNCYRAMLATAPVLSGNKPQDQAIVLPPVAAPVSQHRSLPAVLQAVKDALTLLSRNQVGRAWMRSDEAIVRAGLGVIADYDSAASGQNTDAKDAARYRYLMRQMPCNIADLFDSTLAFDEVDDEIDAAIRLESLTGVPVPRMGGNTCKVCDGTRCVYRGPVGDPPEECEACNDQEPESSPIAEPDTATKAPSESIDTPEFRALVEQVTYHDLKHVSFNELVSHIHSWHQRTTQASHLKGD